jgi:hypothetical protein
MERRLRNRPPKLSGLMKGKASPLHPSVATVVVTYSETGGLPLWVPEDQRERQLVLHAETWQEYGSQVIDCRNAFCWGGGIDIFPVVDRMARLGEVRGPMPGGCYGACGHTFDGVIEIVYRVPGPSPQ